MIFTNFYLSIVRTLQGAIFAVPVFPVGFLYDTFVSAPIKKKPPRDKNSSVAGGKFVGLFSDIHCQSYNIYCHGILTECVVN